MVIKEDGTKWACQSCLKGHRVSGCTHTDRELILVPKKGRPVTQCQHCRSERKKRSAHVSCECGEGSEKPHHSKEKCVHLREAEERAKAGGGGAHEECSGDKAHLAAVAEEQGCCCPHGGKCSCALRKKDTDTDGSVTPPHGPAVKPRLETAKSDGAMTVFQNGHHKPVHRKNHLAHECGMPYKMPMPRAKTDQGLSTAAKARRSIDSLALDNNMMPNPSAFSPQTSAPFNTRSEQHSPKVYPSDQVYAAMSQPDFASIDFSNLGPIQTNQSVNSISSDAFNFNPIEPMSAMADSTYDPWSAMPSAESLALPDNNPFGVWPTNPDVSGMAQPALTAASSGTQSEIDEIPHIDEAYNFGMPSIEEDAGSGTFDFNDIGGLPTSPNMNRRSLPANFLKNMASGSGWPFDQSAMANGTQQGFDAGQIMPFDDSWEGSNLPSVTDMPRHRAHGLPNAGRPASRSVGLSNAPSEDILKSLFPDMGLDSNYFDTNLAQDFSMAGNSMVDIDALNATSQADFGPMDEEVTFKDGYMSIPNDNFTSSYDLNQDFSNPDFSSNWSQ